MLRDYRSQLAILANCTDSMERKTIDVADQKCKKIILRSLYLHERFELREGPSAHCSATSMIFIAKDYFVRLMSTSRLHDVISINRLQDVKVDKNPQFVAVKFMCDPDHCLKEVQMYR